MPRSRDEQAVLAASEAATQHIVQRGTLRISVAELAESAGIAQRTFYRWFPSKEQILRPVFDWGTDEYARMLRESDQPLVQTLEAAFDHVLWGEREERTRVLFPLVFAHPESQAVFFFAVHDGEHRILEPLARRAGLPIESPEVRAAAAAVTASLRVALEGMVATGDDPRPLHARMLRAFDLESTSAPRAAARGTGTDQGGRRKETT